MQNPAYFQDVTVRPFLLLPLPGCVVRVTGWTCPAQILIFKVEARQTRFSPFQALLSCSVCGSSLSGGASSSGNCRHQVSSESCLDTNLLCLGKLITINCCSYARAALARTLAVFALFHSAKRWHIPRTTSLLHKQLRFVVKDHVETN